MVNKKWRGFSLVELLVVIAIIGTITVVTVFSVRGVTDKNLEITVKSDLNTAASQLSVDYFINRAYPDSASEANDGKGLNISSEEIELTYYTKLDNKSYCLEASISKSGADSYYVDSSDGSIKEGECSGDLWIAIGDQVWSRSSVNNGIMIGALEEMSDNGVVEKWCYGGLESNCEQYGALYTWNEAMQYSMAEGSRGVCPVGSHIPSDNEWKQLEMSLGATQAEVDATSNRGNIANSLMVGGSSKMDIMFAGTHYPAMEESGAYGGFNSQVFIWTSTYADFGPNAWYRYIQPTSISVSRNIVADVYGSVIRCVKD